MGAVGYHLFRHHCQFRICTCFEFTFFRNDPPTEDADPLDGVGVLDRFDGVDGLDAGIGICKWPCTILRFELSNHAFCFPDFDA